MAATCFHVALYRQYRRGADLVLLVLLLCYQNESFQEWFFRVFFFISLPGYASHACLTGDLELVDSEFMSDSYAITDHMT